MGFISRQKLKKRTEKNVAFFKRTEKNGTFRMEKNAVPNTGRDRKRLRKTIRRGLKNLL